MDGSSVNKNIHEGSAHPASVFCILVYFIRPENDVIDYERFPFEWKNQLLVGTEKEITSNEFLFYRFHPNDRFIAQQLASRWKTRALLMECSTDTLSEDFYLFF